MSEQYLSRIPVSLIDRYDEILSRHTDLVERASGFETSYRHLRWMLKEIRDENVVDYGAHRWLGFVQCALAVHGFSTVQMERDLTRGVYEKRQEQEVSE